MQEPLEDKTVLLILLSTILLVFCLVFTFLPSKNQLQPDIQWKEASLNMENTVNL